MSRPTTSRPGSRVTRQRLGGLAVIGLGLAAAVVGCNYTGDMNVQPSHKAYTSQYIRPPLPDLRDGPDAVKSVPVNPTPESYIGNPVKVGALPTPQGYPKSGAEGLNAHYYVGVTPAIIDKDNPTPNTLDSRARGLTLYNATCVACHGLDGTRGGVVAAYFQRANMPPSNLQDAAVQAKSDDYMFELITKGNGRMPSIAYELNPSEVWDVIHYIRQWKK